MVYFLIFGISSKNDDKKVSDNNNNNIPTNMSEDALRKFALDRVDRNSKSKGSPGEIWVNDQKSGPITSGKEYIPYHLTEQEKNILRQFNS